MRAATDTVHECRDLWADPLAWQAHLMRRAAGLAGCRVGLYFEMADHAGKAANRILSANDVGWSTDSERHSVVEGLSQHPLRYSPLWAAFADRLALRGRHAGVLVAPQARVIDWSVWASSPMYDRHVRPTRLGQAMLSAAWVPNLSAWSSWSLVTERGDPLPTPRNERLIRLLHQQIAPLIGTYLSTWRDRTISPLSAVRRQVLDALLDGQSEADIARDTFRSRSAVHEHVTALYRHFAVSSRGELAAFFLRGRPVTAGRAGSPSLDAWLDRVWAV